jgi:hypothetical protein
MTPIVFPKVPEKGASDEEWTKYDKNMQEVITRYINDAIKKASDEVAVVNTSINNVASDLLNYVDYNAISLATSGYVDFKNGLQVRWGSFVSNTDDDQTVTFGRAFSNNCFSVIVNMLNLVLSKSSSNFVTNRYDEVSGTPTVYYIAIGY